jgi:aminoglycoside phosphotransferase (APT) family kinase protein
VKKQLADVLKPVIGEVTIENLTTLTGGASRTTWAFDAVGDDGRQALILRTGPPDDVHAGMELEASGPAAGGGRRRARPPYPRCRQFACSTRQSVPHLQCDRGETIVRRIHRSLDDAGRERLLSQCAHALAAIHRADPDGLGLTQTEQLAEWRDRLDEMGDTTATFEWAFRWLAANRPPPTPPRLVHGDFRMGNLIVDQSGLAAVLDWELVHVGEVYEDLAWFCIRAWRFGAPEALGAGGLGSVESFLSAYEEAAGVDLDRDAFRWWLTVATLRWGVICRFQAERHLSGQTPSVELAAIGRRVSETEWDVLDLLREAAEVNWLYGRPTAAELVAAVADFSRQRRAVLDRGPGQLPRPRRRQCAAHRRGELTDDPAAEVTADWPISGSPTKPNWRRPSAQGHWTTARRRAACPAHAGRHRLVSRTPRPAMTKSTRADWQTAASSTRRNSRAIGGRKRSEPTLLAALDRACVASFTLRPSLVIASSRAPPVLGIATRSIKPVLPGARRGSAMMRSCPHPIASARAAWVRNRRPVEGDSTL